MGNILMEWYSWLSKENERGNLIFPPLNRNKLGMKGLCYVEAHAEVLLHFSNICLYNVWGKQTEIVIFAHWRDMFVYRSKSLLRLEPGLFESICNDSWEKKYREIYFPRVLRISEDNKVGILFNSGTSFTLNRFPSHTSSLFYSIYSLVISHY